MNTERISQWLAHKRMPLMPKIIRERSVAPIIVRQISSLVERKNQDRLEKNLEIAKGVLNHRDTARQYLGDNSGEFSVGNIPQNMVSTFISELEIRDIAPVENIKLVPAILKFTSSTDPNFVEPINSRWLFRLSRKQDGKMGVSFYPVDSDHKLFLLKLEKEKQKAFRKLKTATEANRLNNLIEQRLLRPIDSIESVRFKAAVISTPGAGHIPKERVARNLCGSGRNRRYVKVGTVREIKELERDYPIGELRDGETIYRPYKIASHDKQKLIILKVDVLGEIVIDVVPSKTEVEKTQKFPEAAIAEFLRNREDISMRKLDGKLLTYGYCECGIYHCSLPIITPSIERAFSKISQLSGDTTLFHLAIHPLPGNLYRMDFALE